MKSIDELQQILGSNMKALCDANGALALNRKPANLYDPIRYILLQEGKKLRPMLVLMANQICGGNVDDATAPAIGLEMFHNFTLIHDDIMDKAEVRRGKPTVYKKWNSNIAILSGDNLHAMATKFVTTTKPEFVVDMLDIFNETTFLICEGQQYDADFETSDEVTLEQYLDMIYKKTAVLLGAALKMGAVSANADKDTQNKLYDYGCAIGMAFQLMDDMLDVYGNEQNFGKRIGGDILCCKKTYVYLKTLELTDGNDYADLRKYYNSNDMNEEEKIATCRYYFDKYHVEQITRRAIDDYYKRADEIMAGVNLPADKKQILTDFCNQLAHRSK